MSEIGERLGRELKEWAKNEKIIGARTDDKMIGIFLDGCKNDAQEAKRKFINFHKMKQTIPEWFDNRDPQQPSIRDLLDLGVLLPLPQKDDRNRTIIIVRAGANDPSTNPMSDVFKVGMMLVELAMEKDEGIARDGVHVIIDLDGVGLGHAIQMTPGLVKRAVHSWQDCYPIRIIGIDFINCPPYVSVVLKIFRSFMREKLKKRMRAHGRECSSLGEFIDVNRLPREYGGNHGSVSDIAKQWAEMVLKHRHWFIHNCSTSLQ